MKWIRSILRQLLRWAGDTSLDECNCWACEYHALEASAAEDRKPVPFSVPEGTTVEDLFRASGLDRHYVSPDPRASGLDRHYASPDLGGEVTLERVGTIHGGGDGDRTLDAPGPGYRPIPWWQAIGPLPEFIPGLREGPVWDDDGSVSIQLIGDDGPVED